MKRALFLSLLLCYACGPSDSPPPPVDAAEAITLGYGLPGVEEAVVTSSDWLLLSMADPQMDLTGFAAGVCQDLQRRSIRGIYGVRVVDVAYIRANRGFRTLGEARC